MKKLFASLVLSVLCTVCWSQPRKMPFVGLKYQQEKDKHAAAGKMTRVTQITFKSSGGKMDTVSRFKIEFYPSGLLKQTDFNEYNNLRESNNKEGEPDEQRNPFTPFEKIIDMRWKNGTRITYTYDEKENLVAQRGFEVYPKNSLDAMDEALNEHTWRFRRTKEDDTAGKREMLAIIDSLARNGVPEVSKPEKEISYEYNENNNLVQSKAKGDNRIYTYKYDQEGRVTVQRQVYHKSSNKPDLMIAEVHITYAPNGLPATITDYLADGDSNNIAIDKYMLTKQEITYNKNGKIERRLVTEHGKTWQRLEVVEYKDSLAAKEMRYDIDIKTRKKDITANITYTYRKGYRGATKVFYMHGALQLQQRQEIYLNDKGLQAEERIYEKDPKTTKPEVLKKKILNFYDEP